MPFTADEMF